MIKTSSKFVATSLLIGLLSAPIIAQNVPRGGSQNWPSITLLAKDYDKSPGMSQNVAVGKCGSYGADVLLNNNNTGCNDQQNIAGFKFAVPKARAGKYMLSIEYAAMQSRPVDIHLNGKQIASGNAAVDMTGGWNAANQKLLPQKQLGCITLKPNDNIMVVRRAHVFPHFRKFVFTPCNGPIAD
jgi:hypothetical protein